MDYFAPVPPAQIKKEKQKARELRHSQWWKQKLGQGICYYCQNKFSKDELTMDHIVPLARGGKSTKSNVVCACKPCNTKKKYYTPAELELMKLSKHDTE